MSICKPAEGDNLVAVRGYLSGVLKVKGTEYFGNNSIKRLHCLISTHLGHMQAGISG